MTSLERRFFRHDADNPSHHVYSFLTCRLHHSIPFSAREKLMRYRCDCERQHAVSTDGLGQSAEEFSAQLFRFWDGVLGTSPGPTWLAHPDVADFTQVSLHAMEGVLCRLEGYAILPTHVHVCYTQDIALRSGPTLTHVAEALKSPVAHFASRILNLRGPFWQSEDYHRILRSRREIDSVLRYMRRDPVRSGLVSHPEEWPWTWCKGDPVRKMEE
jgi:hypothetical protein